MTVVIRKASWIAFMAVALIVCGCAAPTQKLSDEDRSKFKTVRINSSVKKVPEMFLMAPSGANIGLLFGAVGGAVTGIAMGESQKVFGAFLDKNAISIEKIAREEIELALQESGKFAIAGPGETSAPEINIAVQQYGFGVTHLLSSKVVPVLMIKCDMVDNSGKLFWSASDRLLPSIASPLEPSSWEAMHDNPKLIEEQWRKASKHIAKKIIDEL